MRKLLTPFAVVLVVLATLALFASANPQSNATTLTSIAPIETAVVRPAARTPEGLRIVRLAPLVGLAGMLGVGISLSIRAARRFAA